MNTSRLDIAEEEEQVILSHELPVSPQDIDVDRLVWDPDYRAAVKRYLNQNENPPKGRRIRAGARTGRTS